MALPDPIPRATYRVQLNADFGFEQLTAIIPYLARLGISHVYCSPYFRARPGSQHGYDVIDHNAFNPEIGSLEQFERLVATLREHGMGHILDIVPNHVGIMGSDNAWWQDLLESGPASRYAEFFDVDWTPENPALAGKVLVPVLGEAYGVTLERGELALRFELESGSFAIWYHEHRFPLDPRTYPRVLDRVLAHTSHGELERLRRLFDALPAREDASGARAAERDRGKNSHKAALAALAASDPSLAAAIDLAVRSFQGNAAEPASFDALHELIELQAFRLASWRVAADDINYRRFFDVNDLAALRVENEEVFEETHRRVIELIARGLLDGVRIDHIDGLYDPEGYLHRLRARVGERYLVVEKITASFEHLPQSWPVHGTTGYNFANAVNRMLVDGATRGRMDRLYRAFLGERPEWPRIVRECQHLVLRRSLASELNRVASALARIARDDRQTRDFTFNSLRRALAEVIASFPVYRTYVTESASPEDRRYIDWAITAARQASTASEGALLDFVRAALLNELPVPTERSGQRVRSFAMRFQQITAPITAKGVEDTALYRFGRLASLNEVGGDPDAYGLSVRGFHLDALYRQRHWPHELLATSTHDTKRSEDTRARINVLSEMTAPWRKALDRWHRLNRLRVRVVGGEPAPSPADEYLLYESLIGTWPLEDDETRVSEEYRERICAYMLKAAREAKSRTSWAHPDAAYEEAVLQFIRAALEVRPGNAFLREFVAFQRSMVHFGLLNSLSQTLLRLTAPGVPDCYQGNELWDFSLVDPDNRRPVDYARRRELLASLAPLEEQLALDPAPVRSLLDSLCDGRCKLWLMVRALRLRSERPALFSSGEYIRLAVSGEHAHNVCAFARRLGDTLSISVAPRLYRRLLGDEAALPLGAAVWDNTAIELPRAMRGMEEFRNVLDGRCISPVGSTAGRSLLLAGALSHFPVALLYAESPRQGPRPEGR